MSGSLAENSDKRVRSRLLLYFLPGWLAAKKYLPTMVLIQCFAVILVASYYVVPSFQAVCQDFALWKESGGIPFVVISTVLAGVFVPELAKFVTLKSDRDPSFLASLQRVGWLSLFFAGSGILVDVVYRTQALVFGEGTDFLTVAIKVLVDQTVFVILVGQPYAVLFFLWMEENRNFRRMWKRLNWRLMFDRVFKLALPGWVYWLPMVCCIYSLPSALQFPLFLLGMACWSLVFVHIMRSFKEVV